MGKQKTPAEREIAIRVGARIRQLREIQHVSQIRLATEIGIRAGPLGWIEKGKHLPSGRVLYRIAKQLNVRLDDLFQETDVWHASAPAASESVAALLPPLETEAVAESLKAAHIVCQSVADRLLDLEKFGGAARSADIPLSVPCVPTEAGAECLAASVRQALGIGSVVVGDLLEVLEDAGLRVIFLDLPEGCTTFSGYDGVNRNAYFFINSRLKKQPEVQMERFAFELGRIFWHTRKLRGSDAGLAVDEAALDEAQFAHRFAAAFLMPAVALQTTMGQLGLTPKTWSWEVLLRIKRRYGVSARSFAQRLHALGLSWSDRQKKSPRHYLFKEEIEEFVAANGPASEPGCGRSALAMNGRLGDLLLRAEQSEPRDKKALNAVKRVFRQAGIKLDA